MFYEQTVLETIVLFESDRLLDEVPAGPQFAVMCVVVRAFESLGISAYLTAVLTLIASEFSDCLSFAFVSISIFSYFNLVRITFCNFYRIYGSI